MNSFALITQLKRLLLLLLLSTHADRQGVHILFTVLCVCVCLFVQLRISLDRIKLVVSNFARWFRGVLGRESPILGHFALPEAKDRTNWCAARGRRVGMCG